MPEFKPTKKDRETVEMMAGYGVDHHDICRLIVNGRTGKPISPKTLRKAFRDELDTGMTKANHVIVQSLFQKAKGDGPQSVSACIYWCKVRLGWYDTPNIKLQHSGSISSYDLSKLSDDQIKQLAAILTPAAIAPGDQGRTG